MVPRGNRDVAALLDELGDGLATGGLDRDRIVGGLDRRVVDAVDTVAHRGLVDVVDGDARLHGGGREDIAGVLGSTAGGEAGGDDDGDGQLHEDLVHF